MFTKQIIQILKKTYPNAHCSLDFKTPLELLAATILSAQCTDERVNMVTRELFQKFPSVSAYAKADIKDIELAVFSTGFYKNKAKAIQQSARIVLEKFNGAVPHTMDELLQLPGVARKTANVVLGNAFGIVQGVVVDTHVSRIAGRLGWTREKNPVKIEQDIMARIPKKNWLAISHLLIAHGRKTCTARKPFCATCPLNKFCPAAFNI